MSLLRNKPASTTLLALLFLLCARVDPLTAESAARVNANIRAIRQRYAQINARADQCRQVKKELHGYSLEGGEIRAYFDGDKLLKLELTFLGEIYRAAEEYYYVDGRLIFLYQAVGHYDRTLSGKVVRTQESRGYFREGALIAYLDEEGKRVPPDSDRYRNQERKWLRHSAEFSRGARSPEPELQAAHDR